MKHTSNQPNNKPPAHQLPEQNENNIVHVPDWKMVGNNIDLYQVACIIAHNDKIASRGRYDTEEVARESKIIYKRIQNMSFHKNINILYPDTVAARYHLSYNMGFPVSEKATDNEIKQFLVSQDIEEYKSKLISCCDDRTKKLTLVRVLQATFNVGKSPQDNLPEEMRQATCSALGVSQDINLGSMVKLQEKLTSGANIEQLILARFGYLWIWNSVQTEHQFQVSEFKPKLLT